MTTIHPSRKLTENVLTHARTLYRQLTEELSRALTRLETDGPDPEAKGRAETIRAHRKALQTVLDIEAQFLREAEKAESVRSINVEAARREIYSRLDRLIAAERAGGAA